MRYLLYVDKYHEYQHLDTSIEAVSIYHDATILPSIVTILVLIPRRIPLPLTTALQQQKRHVTLKPVKHIVNISHSHGSVSVVRTTFKVYGKMQTLTLSQPKTPEPIVTKF